MFLPTRRKCWTWEPCQREKIYYHIAKGKNHPWKIDGWIVAKIDGDTAVINQSQKDRLNEKRGNNVVEFYTDRKIVVETKTNDYKSSCIWEVIWAAN